MSAIFEKPELIHDKTFMMDIFKIYRDKLPPFKEYWDEMFTKKQMSVVARKSGAKIVQFAEIKKGSIQAYQENRQASIEAHGRACFYCNWHGVKGD